MWSGDRSTRDGYWEACERWADEQLEAVAASAEEAERGGLSTDLAREIAQEIEALLGPQEVATLDFETLE